MQDLGFGSRVQGLRFRVCLGSLGLRRDYGKDQVSIGRTLST